MGRGKCHTYKVGVITLVSILIKLSLARYSWWRHQMERNIFRVTGPLCGEFTGPGEFPSQRPVTRSFDVFFDLRLNKRLSKQPWGWWFETPPWSLWRQCYVYPHIFIRLHKASPKFESGSSARVTIWGFVYQKQVSSTGKSNCFPPMALQKILINILITQVIIKSGKICKCCITFISLQ